MELRSSGLLDARLPPSDVATHLLHLKLRCLADGVAFCGSLAAYQIRWLGNLQTLDITIDTRGYKWLDDADIDNQVEPDDGVDDEPGRYVNMLPVGLRALSLATCNESSSLPFPQAMMELVASAPHERRKLSMVRLSAKYFGETPVSTFYDAFAAQGVTKVPGDGPLWEYV